MIMGIGCSLLGDRETGWIRQRIWFQLELAHKEQQSTTHSTNTPISSSYSSSSSAVV